jgi:hypothetical protein
MTAVGRVATVVGTTRRLNEKVRRRRPLVLTERGAIQAATICTCRALLSARVRKRVANDLPHCSAVIGFSAVPKCCLSASLMSV